MRSGRRAGRSIRPTLITSVALVVSGSCALVVGPLARASLTLAVIITIVWGISIVADSAQFSTCITELAPGEYVGTALTLQTSLGFLLTIVSIRAVPVWADRWGWSVAFAPLALGPLIGVLAMWALRRSPASRALARGAR